MTKYPARDTQSHARLQLQPQAASRGLGRRYLRRMDGFVERIKQYPAKEQAELRVRVMLPGNMFPGLTPTEQRDKYEAEASGYELAHTFPAVRNVRQKPITCEGVRFLCISDVMDDPQHTGFIIPLADWNRHRHDTYKNNSDAEKVYIRTVATAPDVAAAEEEEQARERPLIYEEFELISTGEHTVKKAKGTGTVTRPCEFWLCKNTSGKCKHRQPFKVVYKASGKLFGHLEKCNPTAHARIKLEAADEDDVRCVRVRARTCASERGHDDLPSHLHACARGRSMSTGTSSSGSPSPRCCHTTPCSSS